MMDENTPDAYPQYLRIRKGKLVHIDGVSITKYLTDWALSQGISENTPVNLVSRGTLVVLTERASSNQIVFCRFCGQSNTVVKKMVAGPGVYICSECVDICNEIFSDDVKLDIRQKSKLSKNQL